MITCPYCNAKAELVTGRGIYPALRHLHSKMFWLCRPCEAWVGCHESGDGTKPLGRLANAELRAMKQEVHKVFDPLWRNGDETRSSAYQSLADKLGIPRSECHVGMFDVEMCRRAIEVLKD